MRLSNANIISATMANIAAFLIALRLSSSRFDDQQNTAALIINRRAVTCRQKISETNLG